jgi:predicted nuclease of restriction endonuclease-like (RecB) superfamily
LNNNIEKNELYNEIKKIIEDSRSQIIRSINSVIVISYWNIGKAIVEKQNRTEKTTYGEKLLEQVSIQIEREYGRGFSKRYLELMRQFYLTFQNAKSLLSQLSWTHYLELIKIKNKEEREWYLNESIKGNLSSRQLHRLITTFTYNRVLNNKPLEVSRDK